MALAIGHEPSLDITVKSDAPQWATPPARRNPADRNRAHAAAGFGDDAARLHRGPVVGAGRRRRVAGAAVRRRQRARPLSISAPHPAARPRSWRTPARASPRSTARRRGWRGCATIWRGCRSRPMTWSTDAAEWPGDDGRLRRHAGRCALHLDRHHPPPSRRRLAAAGSRHRGAGGAAEAAAAKGGRAAQAGRDAGLLHLFAGTGRRRAGDRRASRRPSQACAARRSRPARSRASPKSSPRTAICAPCPAICRTPTRGLAGWTGFTRRGWLNPDFTPDFDAIELICAAFKMVSWPRFRIKRICHKISSHQGQACRSLNADAFRR